MSTYVFALPRTIKNNPYLSLLYDAVVQDSQFVVQPFSFAGVFWSILRRRPTIIHIHWESNIYGSKYAWLSLWRMSYRFALLFAGRALGAKVVWTMHNLASHDYPNPALDRLGRRLMWRLTQAVIIQNKLVAGDMAVAHPSTRVVYIPHGNYIGMYGPPNPEVRDRVRANLGLKRDETLLLSLGAIRPYKRLERLIGVVKVVPGLRLLIAGKGDPAYTKRLRVLEDERINIDARFIPDADVPGLLSAADYAVFTHGESSLTSGAVILALSYGLPVMTLTMPASELIQDGVNGFVANDEQELIVKLKNLARAAPDRELVTASVRDNTWERVGILTRNLYTQLV